MEQYCSPRSPFRIFDVPHAFAIPPTVRSDGHGAEQLRNPENVADVGGRDPDCDHISAGRPTSLASRESSRTGAGFRRSAYPFRSSKPQYPCAVRASFSRNIVVRICAGHPIRRRSSRHGDSRSDIGSAFSVSSGRADRDRPSHPWVGKAVVVAAQGAKSRCASRRPARWQDTGAVKSRDATRLCSLASAHRAVRHYSSL